MNKKHFIFGAVFALLLTSIFSSCVIVATEDSDYVNLYNFRFENNHILECNYTGYVAPVNCISVNVYNRNGVYQYTDTVACSNYSDSRLTLVLGRNLRDGWHVDVSLNTGSSLQTYTVYYYD